MNNILVEALRLIPKSKFQYRLASKTITDEFGQRVNTYGDWINGIGIIQPGIVSSFGGRNVSEKDYKEMGLDISRSTITVWISDVHLSTVKGRSTPDQIKYDNRIWNIVQTSNWNQYNGWRYCYCQEALNVDEEEVENSTSL